MTLSTNFILHYIEEYLNTLSESREIIHKKTIKVLN